MKPHPNFESNRLEETLRGSTRLFAGALAFCFALLMTPATFAEVTDSNADTAIGAGEVEAGALAGHWKLNKQQSDGTSEARPERRGGRRGGFGGGPGGGRGGDRAGDPGGRPGAPGGEEAPTKLEIIQGADEIVVTDGRGRERSYFTDGRETTGEDSRGDEVTESAQWTGDALVVSLHGLRGEATETFRLNADGQLEIVHERPESGDRPAIELRRVYDRVNQS